MKITSSERDCESDKRDKCFPARTILVTRLTNTGTMKNNIDYENNVLSLSRKVRPREAALRKQNRESYAGSTVCYRKAQGACANVTVLAEQMSLDTAIVAAP